MDNAISIFRPGKYAEFQSFYSEITGVKKIVAKPED
jgi:hypothetical protein